MSRITRGVSLIEMVVALGILGVGLVGALRVFPVGLRASQRAERSSRATMVAQRTLEALKVTPWADLIEGETLAHEDGFTVTTAVAAQEVDGLVDEGRLKAISVTVGWDQRGRTRDLTFLTYVRHDAADE